VWLPHYITVWLRHYITVWLRHYITAKDSITEVGCEGVAQGY
jgi:hypothetical protein